MIVVPRPWIAALAFLLGAFVYPIEAGSTGGIPSSLPEKKNVREIIKAAALTSAAFVIAYAFEEHIYYEKWFLVAALGLGGILALAEQERTLEPWVVLSIAYATAWSIAGYYGPRVLWIPAFEVLVVCGGVRPVLASYRS